MYFVYILRSLKNNKSYVGYTSIDVIKRLDQHNLGSNKWTMANGPFKLVYYERFVCKEDAILREAFYKMGTGKKLKKVILDNYGD